MKRIKQKIQKLLLTLAIILPAFSPGLLAFQPVNAAPAAAAPSPTDSVCKGVEATGGTCDPPGKDDLTVEKAIATAINILSIIVGLAAVIMIIVGGFQYITSGGDAGKTATAKNTILFAVIGLVIVALAQVIVRFVLNQVT